MGFLSGILKVGFVEKYGLRITKPTCKMSAHFIRYGQFFLEGWRGEGRGGVARPLACKKVVPKFFFADPLKTVKIPKNRYFFKK